MDQDTATLFYGLLTTLGVILCGAIYALSVARLDIKELRQSLADANQQIVLGYEENSALRERGRGMMAEMSNWTTSWDHYWSSDFTEPTHGKSG